MDCRDLSHIITGKNERMNVLEKGILDDLSFEDLISAYDGDNEGKKAKSQEAFMSEPVKPQYHSKNLKCRFNEYKPCDDQCQYYMTCTRSSVESLKSEVVELMRDSFLQYDKYCSWLKEERFLDCVIDLYKFYAAEDAKLRSLKDESELMNYLNTCVKEFAGQKRNFYKFYLQFRRQAKR